MSYEIPGAERVDRYKEELERNINQARLGLIEMKGRILEANQGLVQAKQELEALEIHSVQGEEYAVLLRARQAHVQERESVAKELQLILEGLQQAHDRDTATLKIYRREE